MKATKFLDFQRQQQQNAKNNNNNDSQNSNRGEQQLDNISNGGSSNAPLSVSAPINNNNNNNNNNNPPMAVQNQSVMSRMQPLPALVHQQQQQQQINKIRLSGNNTSDKNGIQQQISSSSTSYNHQVSNSTSSPVSQQQPSQIPIFLNNNNNNNNNSGMQKTNSFNGNNNNNSTNLPPQHQNSFSQQQQQQQHLLQQQQSNLILFALNSIVENEKMIRPFILDAQSSSFSSILTRFADEMKQTKLELLQKDLEMEKNYSHGLLQANKGLMMNAKAGNNQPAVTTSAPPPAAVVVSAPPKIQKIIETKIEYVPFHVESLQNNLWLSSNANFNNSSFTISGISDVARNIFSSLRNFHESFSEGPLMLFSRKPNPDNHSMKIGLLNALTRVLEKIASTSCFYDEDYDNCNDDGVDFKNKNIRVGFGSEADHEKEEEEVEGEGSRKREFVSLVHQAIQLLSLSKNSSSLAEDFIGSSNRFVNIMMKFSSSMMNQNTMENNNNGNNRRRGRQDQKISNHNNNNSTNLQSSNNTLFCYGSGTENETDLLFSLLSRNIVHTTSRRGIRFFSEFPSSNEIGGNNDDACENSSYSVNPEDNYFYYVQNTTTAKNIAIHDKGNPMYFEDKIRQSFACSTFQLKHFVLPRSLTFAIVLESQSQFINTNINDYEGVPVRSSPLTDSCVQLLSLFLEGLSQAIQHYQQICPIIQKSYRETRYQRLLQEQQQLQQQKKQKEQENNMNTKTNEDNISPIYIDQQQDDSSNLAAPSALVPPTSSTKNVNNTDSTSSPLTTGNDQDKKNQIPAFGSLPQNLAKMPELGHLLNSVRNYFQRYLFWMLSVCPTCPSVCNLVRACFTPSNFSSLLLASNCSNLRPTVMNFTLIRAAECVLAFGDALRRLSLAPQLCAGKSCWPLLVSLYSCCNVIGVCESVLMPNSATTTTTTTQTAGTKTWMTPDQVVAFYTTSTVLTPFVMCWNNCRNYWINNDEAMTKRKKKSSEKIGDCVDEEEDVAVSAVDDEVNENEENCSEDSPQLESSVTFVLYHLIAVRCCDKKNSFVNAKLGAEIMLDYENIVHNNQNKHCSKEKLKKIVANLLNVDESEVVWPDLKRLI